MPTRKKPTRKKAKRSKVITPAFKRAIEKGRRELAEGKTVKLGDLLVEMLKRDARKHAA